ncbi:HTH-type transcriptional activator RhaS [compost metagenome]
MDIEMHPITAGPGLFGPYREPVFTSRSCLQSHQLLTRDLVAHELRWRCGGADTALFRAELGRCSLFVLRYGAEVEVCPQPFPDFVLVQMPLRGSASLVCDGVALELQVGQAAILSPRHEARVLWSADCEQLMVKVPCRLLDTARERLVEEGGLPRQFHLPPACLLVDGAGTRWLRLVATLLEQGAGNPFWLRHLEESLSVFLLTHLAAGEALPGLQSARQRRVAEQLRKVDALMRSRLDGRTSLAELAAAGGLSLRSLNSLCRQRFGQAPMERLRNLRLEAARERLLQRRELSITEVALEFGFANLGRFASYYRERYGELPRQTGDA